MSATWADNNDPNIAVNRSGDNPSETQSITANEPAKRGVILSESGSASYNNITRNVILTVSKNCGSMKCDIPPGTQANTCQDEWYDDTDSCGIIPNACQGTRLCDYNYKEIAP